MTKQKNSTTTYRGREECTATASGSLIRTPSTGSTWPGHKKRDCSFGRQRSHAIIVHDSLPADGIEKMVSQKEQPNFISETLHASAHSEDSSQRCLEIKAAAEATSSSKTHCQAQGNLSRKKIHSKLISEFKEFHKIQYLKTKGRMAQIQNLVDKLRSDYKTESIRTDFGKEKKFLHVQLRNKTYNSKIVTYRIV